MLPEFTLPKEYFRISTKIICSNTLIDCEAIAAVKGIPPILIGNGTVPIIWLRAFDQQGKSLELVRANKSRNPHISSTEDIFNKTTIVSIGSLIIAHSQMTNESTCIVRTLDLRPIGINMFGNEKELNLGGSSFVNNTFQGATYAIGLG